MEITKYTLFIIKGGELDVRSFVYTHPYDLLRDRLMAFPKKAKYIQLERVVLEEILKEYEQLESELADLRD